MAKDINPAHIFPSSSFFFELFITQTQRGDQIYPELIEINSEC